MMFEDRHVIDVWVSLIEGGELAETVKT